MSKGLICDRCEAVITNYGDMNRVRITPYKDAQYVSASSVRRIDLCKDCTETVMQYINNEVYMVISLDKSEDGYK